MSDKKKDYRKPKPKRPRWFWDHSKNTEFRDKRAYNRKDQKKELDDAKGE